MWQCAIWQAWMSEGKESPPSAWPTILPLLFNNTVARFYLFLHTVLRYFYYQHMSLYIFFTSLIMLLHCQMHPLSTHNLYFNLVPSHWLQTSHETFKKLRNAQNSLWEGDCIFKKCECGHLPGWSSSHKILDFPTDLKYTQSSEIMCYLPSSPVWSYWQFWEPQS